MKNLFKHLKLSLLLACTLLGLWAGGLAGFACYVLYVQKQDAVQNVDAIVVLTGDMGRITTGFSLFSGGMSPQLFITGVNPLVTAEDLLSQHKGRALPCCITYDHKARTTIENGIETKNWIDTQPNINEVLLVTSDYHMPRAAQEIQFVLPGITLYKHPIETEKWRTAQQKRNLVFLEYHKFVYRQVAMTIMPLVKGFKIAAS